MLRFSEVAACGLKGEDETKPSIYFYPVVQYLSVDTNFLFNRTCTVVPRWKSLVNQTTKLRKSKLQHASAQKLSQNTGWEPINVLPLRRSAIHYDKTWKKCAEKVELLQWKQRTANISPASSFYPRVNTAQNAWLVVWLTGHPCQCVHIGLLYASMSTLAYSMPPTVCPLWLTWHQARSSLMGWLSGLPPAPWAGPQQCGPPPHNAKACCQPLKHYIRNCQEIANSTLPTVNRLQIWHHFSVNRLQILPKLSRDCKFWVCQLSTDFIFCISQLTACVPTDCKFCISRL